MSDARLPAGVEAAAIVRRVQSAGDFAAILKRGDADRGSLLLVVASRGRDIALLERTLQGDGAYRWTSIPAEPAGFAPLLARRTKFDPDCWVIELDIAEAERFIAETSAAG